MEGKDLRALGYGPLLKISMLDTYNNLFFGCYKSS